MLRSRLQGVCVRPPAHTLSKLDRFGRTPHGAGHSAPVGACRARCASDCAHEVNATRWSLIVISLMLSDSSEIDSASVTVAMIRLGGFCILNCVRGPRPIVFLLVPSRVPTLVTRNANREVRCFTNVYFDEGSAPYRVFGMQASLFCARLCPSAKPQSTNRYAALHPSA